MAENTNAQAPAETGTEMMVYAVFTDLSTGDLIARDLRGVELARVEEGGNKDGDEGHEAHAALANKASQTLAAWYN